jgi:hypothetical protein
MSPVIIHVYIKHIKQQLYVKLVCKFTVSTHIKFHMHFFIVTVEKWKAFITLLSHKIDKRRNPKLNRN